MHLRTIEKPITFSEVAEVLSSTVKQDEASKLITFAGMLLAQTDEDQYNIAFQSESSAGKTYIPLEVIPYFPEDDTILIASASPTAFFH